MYDLPPKGAHRYRVWIAIERDDRDRSGESQPPSAVLLEPAEAGSMSPRQAARYVATFNRVAVAHGRPLRAIALPVSVRYEGDPAPGQAIEVPAVDLPDPA